MYLARLKTSLSFLTLFVAGYFTPHTRSTEFLMVIAFAIVVALGIYDNWKGAPKNSGPDKKTNSLN